MTEEEQGTGKLWALHVGPYHNPNEIYPYLSLPFCSYDPDDLWSQNGDAPLSNSRVLRYNTDRVRTDAWVLLLDKMPITTATRTQVTFSCTTPELTESEAAQFKQAVKDRWFYEWYYDGLPVWGLVGETDMPSRIIRNSDKAKNSVVEPSIYTKRTMRIQYMDAALSTSLKEAALAEKNNPGRVKLESATINNNMGTDSQMTTMNVDLYSDTNSLQPIRAGQTYTFELAVDVVRRYPASPNIDSAVQHRYDRYLDHAFFDQPVHRFTLINSGVIVLSIAMVVGVYLNRICKYNRNPENHNSQSTAANSTSKDDSDATLPLLSKKNQEDNTATGRSCCKRKKADKTLIWKHLSTQDVLSAPTKPMMLAILLGNGWHVVVVMTLIVFGMFFTETNSVQLGHGGFGRLFVNTSLATTFVAGFVSGYYYRQWTTAGDTAGENNPPSCEDNGWKSVLAATALILPSIATPIVLVINAASFPSGTVGGFGIFSILRFVCVWAVVGVPGVVLGTLAGRRWHTKRATKDKTNSDNGDWLPRQHWTSLSLALPTSKHGVKCEKGGARRWWVAQPICGIIPFGVVFIENYYVMTSLWNYKFYIVTETSIGVFVCWFLVTSGTAILYTILFLNNHTQYPQQSNPPPKDWQWQAFRSVATSGAYLFLYSIYYYSYKTRMTGLFQTTYFFGTMLFISAMASLANGVVGHFAASQIIRLLYSNLQKAA